MDFQKQLLIFWFRQEFMGWKVKARDHRFLKILSLCKLETHEFKSKNSLKQRRRSFAFLLFFHAIMRRHGHFTWERSSLADEERMTTTRCTWWSQIVRHVVGANRMSPWDAAFLLSSVLLHYGEFCNNCTPKQCLHISVHFQTIKHPHNSYMKNMEFYENYITLVCLEKQTFWQYHINLEPWCMAYYPKWLN
jgi:hypothetical protein